MKTVQIASDLEVFIYDNLGRLVNTSILFKHSVHYKGYLISPSIWCAEVSIPPFKVSPMAFYYQVRGAIKVFREYLKHNFSEPYTVKLKSYEKLQREITWYKTPRSNIFMMDYIEPEEVTTNTLYTNFNLYITGVAPSIKRRLNKIINKFYRIIEPSLHKRFTGFASSKITFGTKCLRALPLLLISWLIYFVVKDA